MDGQKKCFKCRSVKNIEEFYVHPVMADGRLGKCKECTKSDVRAHRLLNIEAIRSYDRGRARRRVEYQRAYRKRNHSKYVARNKLAYAVRRGKIKRMPCAVCGDPKSQGHHSDYALPLNVEWLCVKHHWERHAK